jgi:hypothetical protein
MAAKLQQKVDNTIASLSDKLFALNQKCQFQQSVA